MKGKAVMHATALSAAPKKEKKVPANQAISGSVQCDVAMTWIIVSEASQEEHDEYP